MLCASCRRSLLANVHRMSKNKRSIVTTSSATNTASASSSSSTTPSPDAISSAKPGISQPVSTPLFPSTSISNSSASKEVKDIKKVQLQGSIPGGTELKGLAYLKAKPQVLAKEDDEYPAWLWSLLVEAKSTGGAPSADLAAMTKKQRVKYERKQQQMMKDVIKPVPVHEQSQDLTSPGDDAVVSLRRRSEITKSSRQVRRKEIRESNFLKSM